ncbi:hypothetical protein POM88_026919 [Heracleum sosnowskyi]|uniref:RRM domain-containing protein n=1 Tax=Heracleum sosnowskyi TaxID=360622 RepID=A0AAD8ML17_9APIA|nr:hypothetical protein POM88_026919 [Heracleum sosnowskyi]
MQITSCYQKPRLKNLNYRCIVIYQGYGKVVEKVLKVSWDGIGEEYSVPRLRELFEVFGEVRDVLMSSCKINKGSAFIVMASKDVVVAATRSVVGYLDNPLLVLSVLRGGKYV